MGAQEFGQLVEAERLKRRWTRSKLAVSVGVLDDGSALDATQIRRIIEGTRKLNRDVIERLIAVLGLDRADAWEAALESADLKPPGLTADYLRKLDLVTAAASRVSPEKLAPVLTLHAERRRRDRRRLRALPDEIAA